MLTARSVKLNGGFHKMVYLDTSVMINNLIEQTFMRSKPKQQVKEAVAEFSPIKEVTMKTD